jgi:hypothetical protein
LASSINKQLAHTALLGFSDQEELTVCRIKREMKIVNAQDIINGLRRYLSESEDDRREIATKIGISWTILSAWLAGEAEPHKRSLARVAGFLRRFGYL